ncbi:hypothetical protein OG440_38345 (plasmid) [Streptomyces sp. NBC_00637]|uniref:hypothetical protein n=1 Tax=Streptomyces sp. NBC_00637 TaxID=2903667 RepID=UPI002F90E707
MTASEPRYTVAWKLDDCGETYGFESSEAYPAARAGARRAELAAGDAYDIELIPAPPVCRACGSGLTVRTTARPPRRHDGPCPPECERSAVLCPRCRTLRTL